MAEQTVNKCQLWLYCWLSLQGVGIRTNLLTVVSMIFPVAPVFITEWRQSGRTRGLFPSMKMPVVWGRWREKGTVRVRPAQTGWMNIPGGEWEKREREEKTFKRQAMCARIREGLSALPNPRRGLGVGREHSSVGVIFFSSLQKQWGWMFIFCHLLSPDLWK